MAGQVVRPIHVCRRQSCPLPCAPGARLLQLTWRDRGQSEVEETMKKLGSYPGFMGYVIINADGIPIRRSVPPHVPPLAACRPFGECAPQCAVIPAATAGEHLSALHTLGRCFVTAPCCARPLLACSPSQLPGPPRCSAVRGAAVDVVPKVARGSARARPVQRRDVPASAIT